MRQAMPPKGKKLARKSPPVQKQRPVEDSAENQKDDQDPNENPSSLICENPPSLPPGQSASRESTPPRKIAQKKQRAFKLLLSEEQEEGLADWLKSNEFLYVKGKREYKDTALKKSVWEKKALELEVDYKALCTWYESVRTRIGKITILPSGSSATTMTDRDQFLLRNFGFLKAQIARIPSKHAVSMKAKVQATSSFQEKTAPPDDSGPEQSHDEDGNSEDEGTKFRELPPTDKPECQKGKSGKHTRRESQSKKSETVMDTLTAQQRENTRLQTHIKSLLTPSQVSAQQLWGSWIGTMADSFHVSLMDNFYQDTFQLVQRYSRQSAQLLGQYGSQPQSSQSQNVEGQSVLPPLTQSVNQNDYIQLETQIPQQTRGPVSNTQQCQSNDANIWNTSMPTAGLMEAHRVPPSGSYDMMATGLQMSGLGNLMNTSNE